MSQVVRNGLFAVVSVGASSLVACAVDGPSGLEEQRLQVEPDLPEDAWEAAPDRQTWSAADICAAAEAFEGDERRAYQAACDEFVDSLQAGFTEFSAQPMATAFAELTPGQHPDRLAIPDSGPLENHGPAGVPMPGVSTDLTPCDFPSWDVDVGVGNGIDSCNGNEKDFLRDALVYTKFFTWRARMAVQAVVDEPDDAIAEGMWNQGEDDFRLATWFGAFDRTRAEVVLETYNEVWRTLQGEFTPGKRTNIQCWKRMGPWDILASILFHPNRFFHKMIANPCAWDTDDGGFWAGGEGNVGVHTWYTPFIDITVAHLGYPFYSIEACGNFFDLHGDAVNAPDPAETNIRERAGALIHEFLHHEYNEFGLIKDQHYTDDKICEPQDDGQRCYTQDECRELAIARPGRAVRNNSSYEHFARNIGRAYLNGWCDDVHNPLCFPSECCGNGAIDGATGEICDGDELAGASCADFGWTEGEVTCVDCQAIDGGGCFGSCGNGAIDEANNEPCDGADVGDLTCADFGFQIGFVSCHPGCLVDTSGCSNPGPSPAPPSYIDECQLGGCDSPEECAQLGGAGQCWGGPCIQTLTTETARLQGMTDPTALFHPKGDFMDSSGNVYNCDEAYLGQEASCVDVNGWGVCRRCSKLEGETETTTTIGCSCADNDDCGTDQECWGGEFPGGGYCWSATGPNSGPPVFQCDQGACGQELTGGADAGSYCEHYPAFGSDKARCEPERCTDVLAQECAGTGAICGEADQCINECTTDSDCQLPGWPAGWCCSNNTGTCEAGAC